MTFGLKSQDLANLHRLVIDPLKNAGCRLYVFGSRATQKNHPFSDLDLLIEAEAGFDKQVFYQVKEAIEEARFPIKVDFVFSEDLAASYRDRVNSEKVEV